MCTQCLLMIYTHPYIMRTWLQSILHLNMYMYMQGLSAALFLARVLNNPHLWYSSDKFNPTTGLPAWHVIMVQHNNILLQCGVNTMCTCTPYMQSCVHVLQTGGLICNLPVMKHDVFAERHEPWMLSSLLCNNNVIVYSKSTCICTLVYTLVSLLLAGTKFSDFQDS